MLPVVLKFFERNMHTQMSLHVSNFLSPYLCGYRKGLGGAMLMNLSKGFDTLNYNLLIAKLRGYGFTRESLKLIKSYLASCWSRTKVNKNFSSWSEVLIGAPQG